MNLLAIEQAPIKKKKLDSTKEQIKIEAPKSECGEEPDGGKLII